MTDDEGERALSDPVTAKLDSEVRVAKERLLDTLTKGDAAWPCSHCGHMRHHPLGEPWIPNDLCEASGMTRDSVTMIALNNLANEGRISFDSRWRVSLPDGSHAR